MKKNRNLIIMSVLALIIVWVSFIVSLDKNEIVVHNTVESIMLDEVDEYSISDCTTLFSEMRSGNSTYWSRLESNKPEQVVYLMNLVTDSSKAKVVMGFRIDQQQYVELVMFQLYNDYGKKTIEEFTPFSGTAASDFCNIIRNKN